jgi:hypothetical protein
VGLPVKHSGLIALYVLAFVNAWSLAAAVGPLDPQTPAMSGPLCLWNPVVFLTVWSLPIFALTLAPVIDGRLGLHIHKVGIAALVLAARLVQSRLASTSAPPMPQFATWPHLAWYGAQMLFVAPISSRNAARTPKGQGFASEPGSPRI